MSLTTCIKKVGASLRAEDKAVILGLSRKYRAEGLTPDEAAIKAVDDQIATVGKLIEKESAAFENLLKSPAKAISPEPAVSKSTPATPSQPNTKIQSAAELRAQADLQAALADLGDIFGKNTRMNMMPEQEAKILPVMVRLFDAAFRIGYIKFKDAAKFTLDKIRAALGSDVADDITLEHLQGAYISMSSGKKGVDGIRAVSNIESKSEVEAHTAQTKNERTGESNAPSTDSRVERDRQSAAAEPAVGDPVSPEPRGTDEATPQTGGRANRSPAAGDFDVPMMARQQSAPSGQSVADTQAQVNKITAKQANGPRTIVVATPADLPVDAPSDARGMYLRGTVYVVASNNVNAREVASTLAHETIAHHGLRNMLGREDWLKLMGNIQLALASGNKPLNAIRAEVRKSYVDENGVYNLDKNQESDEISARAVEDALDANGEFKPGFGFMKSVYAKLAQFLREIGINVKFTNLELQGLLVSSLEGLQTGARTNGVSVSGEPVYSRSPRTSQEAAGQADFDGETAAFSRGRSSGVVPMNNPLGAPKPVVRNVFIHSRNPYINLLGNDGSRLSLAPKLRDFLASFGNLLVSENITPTINKGLGNGLMRNAKMLGDLASTPSFIEKGYGGISAPRQREVLLSVAPFIQDAQILGSVVELIPVDVMNIFTGEQGASNHAGGNKPMLSDLSAAVIDLAVAVAINNPTLVAKVTHALKAAEKTLGLGQGNLTGVSDNRSTASGAGKGGGAGRHSDLFFDSSKEFIVPEPTKIDRLIYELQDSKIDLKRIQESIEKTGQQIIEKWDARLAETLYPGRVAYRSKGFLDTEVKPLLEAMARQNLGMDELADYLHARGAEERNKQIAKVNPAMPDGGAGTNTKGDLMTNQAARDYLANIRPARLQVLDAMAKRVDAITGGTRALLVTEGLEKQSTIDAWEGAYKNYVPMFRDEAEAGAPHPQGSGFSVRGSASKRATGSTKEVTNILAHVLMQREAAITRAEKNRVGLALYGQAMSHPNPEFWTTIKPSMKPAQIAAELMAMGVDPMTAQLGMEGVPTIRTVDPTTGKVVDRPNPMYKSLPGAIPLRVNGEDRVLMINVTGERGARMAASLKNMDGLTELDIAGSIVGKSTRWLASVNTQYNPAFGLTNLTRDVLGGVIHLGNTELRGKALKVLLKTPVAIVGIARELASGGQSGKWQSLYRQFQADGGQTGFKENFRDPNERAKAIESELKGLGRSNWNPRQMTHAILSLLDGFNTTLENAVRLSAYSEALDKGISRANAARLGRELTVDFNRKGRMGAELGPMYAFFNASVQGTNRSIQAIKGPTGAKIIAGGLGLGVAQALMLMMAGYDEDEIPEFVKARALVIPFFGKEKSYITIPYPLGLHIIPNTGRVLTELALNGGKDIGKRTGEAIGEIAGAFNPLGGGNIFTADGALKTLAPTVIDPLIEMGFNKNFAGSSIQREGYGGERDNRPGVARTKESTMKTTTGQVYMEISKAINTMTGGTDYEKGAASPTPEMIRYMTQTVGGGVLRELEKTVNASTAANRGEPVKPSGIPVVGRFYGEVDDNQVQTSRYYKTGDKLAKLDSSFKAMETAGDGEAMKLFAEKNPDVALLRLHRRVGASITEMNKLAVQTVGNPEKSAIIDQARVGLMSALNQAAENAGKATRKATLADMIKAKIKAPAEAEN